MVIPDIENPFVPLPDDVLVPVSESKVVIEMLLDSLVDIVNNGGGGAVEACLGPAVNTALLTMHTFGGRMLLFSAALPALGPGRLRAREDQRLQGTDRECTLRNPEDQFYKKVAAEASR